MVQFFGSAVKKLQFHVVLVAKPGADLSLPFQQQLFPVVLDNVVRGSLVANDAFNIAWDLICSTTPE